MNNIWNTHIQKTWHTYTLPLAFYLSLWAVHYLLHDMDVLGYSCAAIGIILVLDYISMLHYTYPLAFMPPIVLFCILMHLVLAVLYNGWEGGFQFYFFAILFSSTFQPNFSVRIKTAIAAFCLSLFLFLRYATLARWVEPYAETDTFTFIYFTVNLSSVFFLVLILAINYHSRLHATFRQLAETNRILEKMATTDPLTGMLNRRSMTVELEKAAAAVNEGNSYSILLFDVDHFKKFNDRYGHDCGDLVLKRIGSLLEIRLPQEHRASRWGGEEFLIVCRADKQEALCFAENVRSYIEQNVLYFEGHTLQVTVTIGIASLQPNESPLAAVTRADHALLRGKNEGRNRLIAD